MRFPQARLDSGCENFNLQWATLRVEHFENIRDGSSTDWTGITATKQQFAASYTCAEMMAGMENAVSIDVHANDALFFFLFRASVRVAVKLLEQFRRV